MYNIGGGTGGPGRHVPPKIENKQLCSQKFDIKLLITYVSIYLSLVHVKQLEVSQQLELSQQLVERYGSI